MSQRGHHKTLQIYLNDSLGDQITQEQMDELIDVAMSQLGGHFPPLILSSVAVYELPNYRTGRREHFLTVVAIPQGEVSA